MGIFVYGHLGLLGCNIAIMSETKYVFDLITDKAVSHLNNSDGIYVDDWFHTDGVQYDILNGVKIIGEDGYVNFDGDINYIGNEHKDIIRTLNLFAKDYGCSWEGEFYLFDGYVESVFRAPSFEMEDFVDE